MKNQQQKYGKLINGEWKQHKKKENKNKMETN